MKSLVERLRKHGADCAHRQCKARQSADLRDAAAAIELLDLERQVTRKWLRGELKDQIGDPYAPTVCAYCGEMLTGGREGAIEHCQACPENPLVQKWRRLRSEVLSSDRDNSTIMCVLECMDAAAAETHHGDTEERE